MISKKLPDSQIEEKASSNNSKVSAEKGFSTNEIQLSFLNNLPDISSYYSKIQNGKIK